MLAGESIEIVQRWLQRRGSDDIDNDTGRFIFFWFCPRLRPRGRR